MKALWTGPECIVVELKNVLTGVTMWCHADMLASVLDCLPSLKELQLSDQAVDFRQLHPPETFLRTGSQTSLTSLASLAEEW